MKAMKMLVVLTAVVLGALVAADASAQPYRGGYRGYYHGGHSHNRYSFGFVFGAPGYWYPGPYYAPPYYAYPYYPPVIVRQDPPVYIEQQPQAAPQAPAAAYWYYCPNSQAYYPYVSECAGPWQRVAPQPPPS